MTCRLVHVSDLHMCAVEGRENVSTIGYNSFGAVVGAIADGRLTIKQPASYASVLAEGLARFLYRNQSQFDAVILTGDLATTGKKEDLVAANLYLERPATSYLTRANFPTLSNVGKPIVIMPGNHDRYHDDLCQAGSHNFDDIFSVRWGRAPCRVRSDMIKSLDSMVGIVNVDYSLMSNSDSLGDYGYFGQGRAYDHITDEAERQTTLFREQHKAPVMWAIHFPPTLENQLVQLIDMEKVVDRLDKLGIDVVLSGHLHRKDAKRITRNGVALLAGSATLREWGKGNWVHVLQIETHGTRIAQLKRVNFRWMHKAGEFMAIGPSETFSFN